MLSGQIIPLILIYSKYPSFNEIVWSFKYIFALILDPVTPNSLKIDTCG